MDSEYRGQLSSADDILRFLFGGDAIFTVVSRRTGVRFTYKVHELDADKRKGPEPVHFVKLLSGPDNLGDYKFMGTIFGKASYRHSRKAHISEQAPSSVAWTWFYNRVLQGKLDGVDVYHEGRCGRCGRTLTVPESVVSGFGPECRAKLGLDTPNLQPEPPAGPGAPAPAPQPLEAASDSGQPLSEFLAQVMAGTPGPAPKARRRGRKPTVTSLGGGMVECVVRDARDGRVPQVLGPWTPNPPDCTHGNDPDLCSRCEAA